MSRTEQWLNVRQREPMPDQCTWTPNWPGRYPLRTAFVIKEADVVAALTAWGHLGPGRKDETREEGRR